MGLEYILVNLDKKEQIGFHNIRTGFKLRELSGTIISSTIVTYYLLTNTGDRIGFINDTDYNLLVCGKYYKSSHFKGFVDVTDRIIEELIENEIIKDNGIHWVDKEDNLYYHDLINVWDTN